MKNTQQNKILELLKERGILGVNSYDLTYVYSIKQAPTRIKELREQGYQITSTHLANRSVQYVLAENPPGQLVSAKVDTTPFAQEEVLVPVKKTFVFLGREVTRICWEKPEDIEPRQEALL